MNENENEKWAGIKCVCLCMCMCIYLNEKEQDEEEKKSNQIRERRKKQSMTLQFVILNDFEFMNAIKGPLDRLYNFSQAITLNTPLCRITSCDFCAHRNTHTHIFHSQRKKECMRKINEKKMERN